jgi:hypothetical protein
MDFTQKNCLWPAESKSVGIFEISPPILELYMYKYIYHFLTMHITVRDFLFANSAFWHKDF